MITKSVVGRSGGVAQQRCTAGGSVEVASVVRERAITHRGVVVASCVNNKRCRTGGGVAPERKPADSRVINARTQIKKGILAFGRVKSGITPVGRRDDSLRLW